MTSDRRGLRVGFAACLALGLLVATASLPAAAGSAAYRVLGIVFNVHNDDRIPQATINVYDAEDSLVGSTTANDNGEYVVEGLTAGEHTVEFLAEGYHEDVDEVALIGPDTEVDGGLVPLEATMTPFDVDLVTGSITGGGTKKDLNKDDGDLFKVKSAKDGSKHKSTWQVTFFGVPHNFTDLEIIYKGSNSKTCTQKLSARDRVDKKWVTLDSRRVGDDEKKIQVGLPGDQEKYLNVGASGWNNVEIKFSCKKGESFTSKSDRLVLRYDDPGF